MKKINCLYFCFLKSNIGYVLNYFHENVQFCSGKPSCLDNVFPVLYIINLLVPQMKKKVMIGKGVVYVLV